MTTTQPTPEDRRLGAELRTRTLELGRCMALAAKSAGVQLDPIRESVAMMLASRLNMRLTRGAMRHVLVPDEGITAFEALIDELADEMLKRAAQDGTLSAFFPMVQ